MTEADGARSEASAAEGRMQNLRRRALAEGKQFLVLFLYLWILFGLFVLNKRIILQQDGIDYAAHGFAIFNAFILAKVMLIAQELDLSRWLNRQPLIYPIIHDSFLFGLLFIVFHITEGVFINLIKGRANSIESALNIGGGGISGIVCVSVIFFFTLIPFFAFRNFNRALGPERMKSLLFGPDRAEFRRAGAN